MSLTVRSENIEKLKILVDELDNNISEVDKYKSTLNEIMLLINDELKLISKLHKSDNKLRHYEGICKSILALISTRGI